MLEAGRLGCLIALADLEKRIAAYLASGFAKWDHGWQIPF
jgi:hypothetical protein